MSKEVKNQHGLKPKPDSAYPGIESVAAPYRTFYRSAFNQAKRVLTHSSMPLEVTTVADQATQSYALSLTSKQRVIDQEIKVIARLILDAGETILSERGWSTIPKDNNFAGQLYGHKDHQKSNLHHILEEEMIGINPNLIISFSNNPELFAYKYRSEYTGQDVPHETDPMFELYLDFLRKLHFFEANSETENQLISQYAYDYFHMRGVTKKFPWLRRRSEQLHPKLALRAEFYSDVLPSGEFRGYWGFDFKYKPTLYLK